MAQNRPNCFSCSSGRHHRHPTLDDEDGRDHVDPAKQKAVFQSIRYHDRRIKNCMSVFLHIFIHCFLTHSVTGGPKARPCNWRNHNLAQTDARLGTLGVLAIVGRFRPSPVSLDQWAMVLHRCPSCHLHVPARSQRVLWVIVKTAAYTLFHDF